MERRDVLFKKHNGKSTDLDFTNHGIFLGWGLELEDTGDNLVNYTVGLIELPDGEVTTVLPWKIKFLNQEEHPVKNYADHLDSPVPDMKEVLTNFEVVPQWVVIPEMPL